MIPDRPDADDELVVATISEIAARQLTPLEEAVDVSGVEEAVVVGLCERRIVAPAARDEAGTLYFDHRTVFQLRRIERYRETLGLDAVGIEVVLGLLERIDALERELRWLRERIP